MYCFWRQKHEKDTEIDIRDVMRLKYFSPFIAMGKFVIN